MENNKINKRKRGLKINNDTRQSIERTMKAKRRIGWVALFVSIALVVSPYIFLKFHWPGGNIMYLGIPLYVALLAISIFTLTTSKATLEALEINNQSAFDEALSKWTMRDLFAFGGYILVICLFLYLCAMCVFVGK